MNLERERVLNGGILQIRIFGFAGQPLPVVADVRDVDERRRVVSLENKTKNH